MPNSHRGEVALANSGLVLCYDINAVCEVEGATGANIPALLANLQDGTPPSFSTIRLLLWAGLRPGKPEMTLAQAGEALQAAGLQASIKAVGDALLAAEWTGEEGEPGKNQ